MDASVVFGVGNWLWEGTERILVEIGDEFRVFF